MKKIYMLTASLLMAGAVSAQTIVNGDFEAPIQEAIPGKISQTAGWGVGLFSPVTTNPGEGLQSVSLKTFVDAAIAAQAGSPNDTLGGQIVQEINGPVPNTATLTLDFMYKYAPVDGDVAVVAIEVYDTLLTGAADDVLLYQGLAILSAAKTAWTNRTITLDADGTGTANQIFIIATASAKSVFSGATSLPSMKEGSELLLDKMVLKNSATTGVNEATVTTASVYPNPAVDVLNFKLEGADASSVTIFSLDGKVLISQSVNGSNGSVNVSELNTGMYIYQIATVNGETVKSTFVKK